MELLHRQVQMDVTFDPDRVNTAAAASIDRRPKLRHEWATYWIVRSWLVRLRLLGGRG